MRGRDAGFPTACLIFAPGVVAYAVAVFQRASLGVAGVEAQRRFGITAAVLALFAVLQLAVYAALQFQSGISLIHASLGASFDRRMRAAAQLTGTQPYRAYERLDRELAAQAAPAAAYASGTTSEFFGSHGLSAVPAHLRLDLGALCLTG